MLPLGYLQASFFPGVLLQLHTLIFLSMGLGGHGFVPCNVQGRVEPRRKTAPVASSTPAFAQLRLAVLIPPLCPHTYTTISSRKSVTPNCWHQLGRKQCEAIATARVSEGLDTAGAQRLPGPNTSEHGDRLTNEKHKHSCLCLSFFKEKERCW